MAQSDDGYSIKSHLTGSSVPTARLKSATPNSGRTSVSLRDSRSFSTLTFDSSVSLIAKSESGTAKNISKTSIETSSMVSFSIREMLILTFLDGVPDTSFSGKTHSVFSASTSKLKKLFRKASIFSLKSDTDHRPQAGSPYYWSPPTPQPPPRRRLSRSSSRGSQRRPTVNGPGNHPVPRVRDTPTLSPTSSVFDRTAQPRPLAGTPRPTSSGKSLSENEQAVLNQVLILCDRLTEERFEESEMQIRAVGVLLSI